MSSVIDYLRDIEDEYQKGTATEHTYRPALVKLISALGEGKTTATNEPKHVECGALDIAITKNTPHGPLSVGYIETKNIDESLDNVERTEQLKRYLAHIQNLILTDYLEFRWYVDGKLRDSQCLGRIVDKKIKREKDGAEAAAALIASFLEREPEPVASPQILAERMAHVAHMIRDIVISAYEVGQASESLKQLRGAFAKTLIPDIDTPAKTPEFADMYAQTLVYGLFAARCNHRGPGNFQRQGVWEEIPKTNPFLRKLFEKLTGSEMEDEPYNDFVKDLVGLLAHADMEEILAQFGKRKGFEDPVLHFYETFLATYDPKLREKRGIYYTPEPVVSYMVRSVDHILKEHFGLKEGFADTATVDDKDANGNPYPKVLILDPACGTGTFLYAIIKLKREHFREKRNAGMWRGHVGKTILRQLFGFELLMAPYSVAHFKLGMLLAAQDLDEPLRQRWAYDFSSDERLGIYLTNTLEEVDDVTQLKLPFEKFIIEEASAANKIKHDLPIMVIIGNPPYSGHSANMSEWIMGLLRGALPNGTTASYYEIDGKPLGERNPKWLQDDYVKFIRWGQWRIEQTGHGILAFVTNHAYLDNPTFRGMRQQLMKAFDEIYILNLHGNAKKKERAPDGSKDENVFDIQQGVAIGIFIKGLKKRKANVASICYKDYWGLRSDKHNKLDSNDIKTTRWEHLNPKSPFYFFVPQKTRFLKEYNRGWKITDVMPVNSAGIVTARDSLTIKWSEREVLETVKNFISLPVEEARSRYKLGMDTRDWKVSLAQEDIRRQAINKNNVKPVLYRPFDIRYTYYTGQTRGFICMPRPEVVRHILAQENIAILTCRQQAKKGFHHVLCANNIVESCAVSLKTKEITTVFPLYLYPDPDVNGDLFSNGAERHVNLNPEFIADIEKRLKLKFIYHGGGNLKKTFGPEDVFNYIYAIFHSPTYRERYKEFLKIDFPRVPLTSDIGLFRKLCEKGDKLVRVHLLESPLVSQFITNFDTPGDNFVEKGYPKYLAPGEPEPGTGKKIKRGRVYINKEQYFDGAPPEIWDFQVGGYQVCRKWLKDRVGRKLTDSDDLPHYQKIIAAINETIRLMEEIDAAIPNWPIS